MDLSETKKNYKEVAGSEVSIFSQPIILFFWARHTAQSHHVKQLFFGTGVAMVQGSPFP